MIRLSQRDPKWANKKLGLSLLTIGRFGCTTTSISMLSDYFGQYLSPDKIANHGEFYTKEGLILWGKLSFGNFKFLKRGYGQNDSDIQTYLKDPKKAVILEVNNEQHWVVAIKKQILFNITKSYIVADPWLGKDVDCKKTYHNITGYALFSKR